MAVNIYDEILPQSVHFILDGESFNLPGADENELEEAISILASELVLLRERAVPCSLSVCQGKRTAAADILSGELSEMLYALAAYEPIPLAKGENGEYLKNKTEFTRDLPEKLAGAFGTCWYICKKPPAKLFAEGAEACVLPYDEAEGCVSLRQLREGGA